VDPYYHDNEVDDEEHQDDSEDYGDNDTDDY
jgi:hypothetical protein